MLGLCRLLSEMPQVSDSNFTLVGWSFFQRQLKFVQATSEVLWPTVYRSSSTQLHFQKTRQFQLWPSSWLTSGFRATPQRRALMLKSTPLFLVASISPICSAIIASPSVATLIFLVLTFSSKRQTRFCRSQGGLKTMRLLAFSSQHLHQPWN